ncbi:hypothetical protein L1887_29310 [Cichorium endivia]|nr:hypothetical protein L1887_29310 [Cichorium endivia]
MVSIWPGRTETDYRFPTYTIFSPVPLVSRKYDFGKKKTESGNNIEAWIGGCDNQCLLQSSRLASRLHPPVSVFASQLFTHDLGPIGIETVRRSSEYCSNFSDSEGRPIDSAIPIGFEISI